MLSTQHTALLHRIRHTEEPSIAFKVGGLDALAAMDKVQAHDETTQDSGSRSGYSDLSALENETDDFGRRLLQHQRDVQRLNSAIRPGQQAFKRARPRARLAERVEQEERRDGDVHERAGSGGSNDLEPPLNLPKQWGTKGKRRSDWLRKLHAPTEMEVPMANGEEEELEVEQAERRPDGDAIMAHRTAYTGDDNDWVAVADETMDALETTPPSMRRHTPTSMRHLNLTLGDSLESDDNQEFSSASLLASTPAVNVNRRNRRIDELTRREIESIEKRGVTKRTLEHILEQSTITTTPKSEPRPVSAPSPDTTRATPRRRRSLIANKENLPPHADVNGHGAYKGAETIGLVNRTAEAAVTFKNSSRPAHKRTDSYNLLKRLARVSSLSPSPARAAPLSRGVEVEGEKSRPRSGGAVADGRDAVGVALYAGMEEGGGLEREMGRERPHTSAGELATPPDPLTDAEDEDLPDLLPDIQVEAPDIDATPAPNDHPQYEGKTRVVTGAWLDTPGPGIDVRPLLQSTDSTIVRAFGSPSAIAELEPRDNPMDADPRRVFSEPAHAKSALADVLKEVKELERREGVDLGDEEGLQMMGETTIQSLEDIVSPDLRVGEELHDTTATMTLDIITETVIAQEVDADASADDEAPKTQAQRDRRQEKLAMEAMNKHLRAARTSIKDANRGLRRVENRMDAAAIDPRTLTPSSPYAAPESDAIDPHGTQIGAHAHAIPCPTCGGNSNRSFLHGLTSDLLSCLYTPPEPPSHPRGRPTYLALTLSTLLLYSLLETLLCARYCHPRYASSMAGYGVDPEAPRWPFVFPTLALRPVRFLWGPVWEAVGAVVGNYFGAGDVGAPVGVGVGVPVWLGEGSVLMGGMGRGAGGKVFGTAAAGERVVGTGAGSGSGHGYGHGYGLGSGWVKTTTAAVVSATARVAKSVVDAVDEVGSMWDDEFVL
ncbi:hypothetical protein B0A55_02081 [Friedmanniomyces simplex]|uniref:Uncharacterized protein n=1 Tax=Friedmanniomyces simplex TaxID=329884 RepID=A0A4U0XZD7_9PEZI|nr:hypothetical protein B0A55_02081 [Friedmanniomyces simplex]